MSSSVAQFAEPPDELSPGFVQDLIDKIMDFVDLLSGNPLHDYQRPFSRRIVESVVIRDAEVITGLAARQALALHTPILTPHGWSTMGNLRVGDEVIHPSGAPTPVVDVSEVFMEPECYRITFAGGQQIIADAPHRWLVWNGQQFQTLTTADLLNCPTRFSIRRPAHMDWGARNDLDLEITSIEAVPSEPTRCIAVAHPDEMFLAGKDLIPTLNSGKSEAVANVVATLMVLMPRLARMFPKLLGVYKDGIWIGLFAPVEGQVETLYNRVISRLTSERAKEILSDPEIDVKYKRIQGVTRGFRLIGNESTCFMMTCNPKAKIESKTFHLIIVDECQASDDVIVTKCLAEDTPIWLPDGTVRTIKEVVENRLPVLSYANEWDYLRPRNERPHYHYTCTGEHGGLIGTVPTDFIDNGVQDVWRITLASGREVEATAEHRWVVRERRGNSRPHWKSTTELSPGMNVPLPTGAEFWGDRLTYDDGYFVGQMLGDGCLVADSPVWCGQGPSLNWMSRYVERFGVSTKITHVQESGLHAVAFTKPGNGKNPLMAFLEQEKLRGLKGCSKRLIRDGYSREFYRGFVSGLWDSDGTVSGKTAVFSNISEQLVRQVSDALLRLGIPNRVASRKNNGSFGKSPKMLWEVFIRSKEGVEAFAREVSLLEPHKHAALLQATEHHAATQGRTTRHVPSVHWDRIVEITYAGKKQTYCVTVEPSNLLIANGVVTGNSISPMLAHYRGAMVKIGTPSYTKNNFYKSIQMNKRAQTRRGSRQLHFQWDWKDVIKEVPDYEVFIRKEMLRVGEDSDEFAISYCVAPEAQILTADLRYIRADEVSVGMELVGFDEDLPGFHEHRKFRTAVVEGAERVVLPSYRITLSDGTTVVASEDHMWLVRTSGSRTEWRKTKDLASKRYSTKGQLPLITRVMDVWEEAPRTRLLKKFRPEMLGSITRDRPDHPQVVSVEFLGDQEVVALKTSTKTLVVEGLASHNSCKFVLERGMFVSETVMEELADTSMETVKAYHNTPVVVGIDPARKQDATVVTVVYVDWDRPDEFGYFHHRVLNWLEIQGDDWESQYHQIVDFLGHYNVLSIAVDSNGVGDAVAQRLALLIPRAEVIPVSSSVQEQSVRFKHLQSLIQRKQIAWPGHSKARRLRTWKRFYQQMIDAEKQFKGANFLVAAPDEPHAKDDFVDSLSLACRLTKDLTLPTVQTSRNVFYR